MFVSLECTLERSRRGESVDYFECEGVCKNKSQLKQSGAHLLNDKFQNSRSYASIGRCLDAFLRRKSSSTDISSKPRKTCVPMRYVDWRAKLLVSVASTSDDVSTNDDDDDDDVTPRREIALQRLLSFFPVKNKQTNKQTDLIGVRCLCCFGL